MTGLGPLDRRAQVWIGLAEVIQRPGAGALMDRNGAYVNVLGLATTAVEFRQVAAAALGELGFELVGLEEAEPLAMRLEVGEVDANLLILAREVETSDKPRFGPFHTWTSEDTEPGQ